MLQKNIAQHCMFKVYYLNYFWTVEIRFLLHFIHIYIYLNIDCFEAFMRFPSLHISLLNEQIENLIAWNNYFMKSVAARNLQELFDSKTSNIIYIIWWFSLSLISYVIIKNQMHTYRLQKLD